MGSSEAGRSESSRQEMGLLDMIICTVSSVEREENLLKQDEKAENVV